MDSKQAIPHPHGITVMGSAVIFVEPDMASLRFDVSRVEAHPRDAFRATREAAQAVRTYLAAAAVDDVATSRITLRQEYEYGEGRRRQPRGYRAEIDFNVVLHEPQLERLEEILIGVVDAGAHDISSVAFDTSRLREFRDEARRIAIQGAREKAEMYCAAAGVRLGPVLHIEDIDPQQVEVSPMRQQLGARYQPEHDKPPHAFDPGSIRVAGVVVVSFGLITGP